MTGADVIKRIISAVLLGSMLLLAGCAAGGENTAVDIEALGLADKPWFDAVITDMSGSTVIAECTDCPDNVISAGSLVSFSIDYVTVSASLSKNDRVRIYYDGNVMETYPLQLGEVYAVIRSDGTVQCE